MHDRKASDGLATILAILLAVVLLIGGGALYVLLQRQQAIVAFETARIRSADAAAEAARQEALQAKASQTPVDTAIRNLLQTQQEAWNAGDLDGFMQVYWHSNELTFSSGGKVTRGWQATFDGYKQRYATRADMGTLSFGELEITLLGNDAALVLGNWQLTRDQDTPDGKFSLVLRRLNGQWLIVHDHTSKRSE